MELPHSSELLTISLVVRTFAFVDNWTVAGMTKEEHDVNLKKLLDASSSAGYKFNDSKSVIGVTEVS